MALSLKNDLAMFLCYQTSLHGLNQFKSKIFFIFQVSPHKLYEVIILKLEETEKMEVETDINANLDNKQSRGCITIIFCRVIIRSFGNRFAVFV